MKAIRLIIICLLIAGGLQAQLPQGRTKATIIADALAQLPADNQTQYSQTMTDLVSTGEEGLLELIGRMNPPGNQSNERLDYAISVGPILWQTMKPDERLLQTLWKSSRPVARQRGESLVIRQLGQIGTDQHVESLAALLKEEQLSAPAAQALVSIGSEKAKEAIAAELSASRSEKPKINLINALGQARYSPAEQILLSELGENPSEEIANSVLAALGSMGTRNAIVPLKNAAKKVNYSYQGANGATAAYISLLKRLVKSDPKEVAKEGEQLLAFAVKQNRPDLKVAASQLLLEVPSVNKGKLLNSALKDGDIKYLTRLLEAYPFHNDRKATEKIVKELTPKASAGKQAALIYWIGNHKIANGATLLSGYATSGNRMVQKAAISSLAKIGNEQAMLVLAGLLKTGTMKPYHWQRMPCRPTRVTSPTPSLRFQ